MDITERKRAEDALIRMSSLAESSEDAIIAKTIEGVITSWNTGATRLYGYSSQEMIGKHISVLVPERHPDELDDLRRLAAGDHIPTLRDRMALLHR